MQPAPTYKKLMVEAPISTPDPGSWENIVKKHKQI